MHIWKPHTSFPYPPLWLRVLQYCDTPVVTSLLTQLPYHSLQNQVMCLSSLEWVHLGFVSDYYSMLGVLTLTLATEKRVAQYVLAS